MNATELDLTPKKAQVFEGNYLAAMSELREAGFTPWSTEDIMAARNEVPVDHPRWNNYVDTDFGIAATKKKIYLTPRSARLRAATPNTRLTSYGLPMEGAALDEATTYSRSDLILNRHLTEKEARASPVWLDFAAGSQELVDAYVENTFRFGKDKFNYDTMMGIFVPTDEKPIERAVVLVSLYYRSRACGYYLLLDYVARLVGVREGAPQARTPKKQGSFRTPAENEFVNSYGVILADPESAAKALNDKTAAGLLEIISTYFNQKL